MNAFLSSLCGGSILFLITLIFPVNAIYAEGSKHTNKSLSFYVDINHGKDSNPGTIDLPFKTIQKARDNLRGLKTPNVPVTVYIREGIYYLSETIVFGHKDSGSSNATKTYMAYQGENIRIIGAIKIEPSWFKPVSDKSPVWNRIDASVKGNLMQVDLKSHGITDYGTLQMRGWGAKGAVIGAMELFYDGEPMTLARWPNKDFTDDKYASHDYDNDIHIYGITKPDITGLYIKSGTQDGVPAFKRKGLVDGKQYNLYRYTWDKEHYRIVSFYYFIRNILHTDSKYEGSTYTAWFITTGITGYPTKDEPWWYLYSNNLGQFKPANMASGIASYHNPRIYKGFTNVFFVPENDNDGQANRYGKTFVYSGDRPTRWKNAEDIWFHGRWWYLWADTIIKGTVDTDAKTITLNEKPTYGIKPGQPFYAMNLLEEIDTPGEWYLDRKSGIIYFWPLENFDTSEMYLSILGRPLLYLNGTSYLTFKNLTFEMTRAKLVQIMKGSHNLFDNCKFRNAGTDAVDITGSNNGLNYCEIQWCPGIYHRYCFNRFANIGKMKFRGFFEKK